jgi:peroxiredoxin Q/BCP
LKRSREIHALPFHLLSDPKGELADAFGVPHAMGFAKRQAFLFKDGVLVWRDLHAATEQQAADVLAAMAKHG